MWMWAWSLLLLLLLPAGVASRSRDPISDPKTYKEGSRRLDKVPKLCVVY
jgi:hypothetical protein